jgi:hypothetical protein
MEKNIVAVFVIRRSVADLLTVLSEAITPGTESIRMLKHARIDTTFNNFFLRIATSF